MKNTYCCLLLCLPLSVSAQTVTTNYEHGFAIGVIKNFEISYQNGDYVIYRPPIAGMEYLNIPTTVVTPVGNTTQSAMREQLLKPLLAQGMALYPASILETLGSNSAGVFMKGTIGGQSYYGYFAYLVGPYEHGVFVRVFYLNKDNYGMYNFSRAVAADQCNLIKFFEPRK